MNNDIFNHNRSSSKLHYIISKKGKFYITQIRKFKVVPGFFCRIPSQLPVKENFITLFIKSGMLIIVST